METAAGHDGSARAGAGALTVKQERHGSLTFPQHLRFRDTQVHRRVLRTLTASDHYFDLHAWRWWSPREVAAAFGVPASSVIS